MKEIIFYTLGIYLGVGFLIIVYFDLNIFIRKINKNSKALADETFNLFTWGIRAFIFFGWPFFLKYFYFSNKE
ncbi:MAG: hypothetical protein WCX46_03055 [Candidatus Paceibacterota bacterium]